MLPKSDIFLEYLKLLGVSGCKASAKVTESSEAEVAMRCLLAKQKKPWEAFVPCTYTYCTSTIAVYYVHVL